MGTNEQIVEIIKGKGPSLPIHVSKLVNDSLLFTSARLSELVASKKLRISHLKVGGSPLYYFPGQEDKLQDFSAHIKGIERGAFDVLKEQKVVADDQLEPAHRVALRSIKDFAIPLEVIFEDNKKIFWKWYLLPKEEAEAMIRVAISQLQSASSLNSSSATQMMAESESVQSTPPAIEVPPQTILRKPELEKEIPFKEPEQPALPEPRQTQTQLRQEPVVAPKPKKQRQLKPKIKKEPAADFAARMQQFFSFRKVHIILQTEIKKNAEINYLVQLDSSFGKLTYFCKAKDKKSISENDISHALVQAQEKRLPLLFIAPGEANKKAQELLAQHHAIFAQL